MKNLRLFLSAGFDTISNTLTSVCYFLHKYPKEREKIKEEIVWVLSSDISLLTSDNLDQMDYLSYFIKEV